MAKRRLNGEGSITMHKGSGLYTAMITDEDGKRHHFYDKTQAGAKKKLRDALRKKEDDGQVLNPARITLKTYLNNWLGGLRQQKPKTLDSYESIVRVHLIQRLGHIKLRKLTEDHINKAWNDMIKDGHSTSVVEHCHNVLGNALQRAVLKKLVKGNPMVFVEKPIAEPRELRGLSVETTWEKDKDGKWVEVPSEYIRVLEEAKGSMYYSVILTAIHTGMRRNELLALRWKDIDFDKGRITLTKNLYVGKGGAIIYQNPKTQKKGARVRPMFVVLSAESWANLKAELQRQMDEGLFAVTGDSPVFLNEKGTLLLPRAVTNAFHRIVEKLGIEGVRFHDLRRTHLTMLSDAGVDPKTIQARAGHSDITTTMDTYVQPNMKMQEDAVERFNLAVNDIKAWAAKSATASKKSRSL